MSTDNRGWVIEAVSWPFFGLSLVLVVLRIWTRTAIIRSWGWDDAFICLATVCAFVNTVLSTIGVQYGTGRHASDLSTAGRILSSKYNWLSQGFHVMSTNWGKVSVALFLLRIISKVKHHKPAVYGGVVLLTLINSVCVYTIYGQCTPTARLWDDTMPGRCWDPTVQRNYAFFQGSFSAFSDLILALYPIFTIWDLHMAHKVKIGLGCVLSLGIIAMIAAIVKTIHLASLTNRSDYSWATVDLNIWVAVEQYLIIIAACIPTLTPLLHMAMWRKPASKHVDSPNYIPSPGCGYAPFPSVSREHPLQNYRRDMWGPPKEGDVEARVTEQVQGILMTTEIHVRTGTDSEYER